ncbi:hypothetical protein J5U22_01863 [Saccharolobus shibatae]|uniref:Uncharacterized protein n=1 Tax=Saccharolobus shibatae TaxID=2286 RepID=A0A8F5C1K8_9CREN|nr:hypothetical protein J5U22_01863 [Saccharolobus shibatae]
MRFSVPFEPLIFIISGTVIAMVIVAVKAFLINILYKESLTVYSE